MGKLLFALAVVVLLTCFPGCKGTGGGTSATKGPPIGNNALGSAPL
jgi:hypothetical protein